MECDGETHAAAPPRWHVGYALGGFQSDLFLGPGTASIQQLSALVAADYHLKPRLTIGVAAGAVLGGTLYVDGAHQTFSPGPVVAVSASYLFYAQKGARPFVEGSLSGSVSVTRTHAFEGASENFVAVDVRAGAVVGWTIWKRLSPFFITRVFGGPILWRDAGSLAVGTDQYHFQLGTGAVLRLPLGMDISAEIVPLGERAVSIGTGFTF